MKTITELERYDSPAPLPQGLAWDGTYFWMGSLENQRVYQIDPNTWKVLSETQAPGVPYGIASVGDELRVLCGETSEDHRYIRRFIPSQGFDPVFKIQCPDDTGSQLGFDGQDLHVSQWYNQKVHALDSAGAVLRSYQSPHGICGQVIVGSVLYLATTDREETDEYFLTRIDLDAANPVAEDIAAIPFKARALAFDGKHFWSNHRAAHQTVRFTLE